MEYGKKRKTLYLLILAICFLFVLPGCTYKFEEEAEKRLNDRYGNDTFSYMGYYEDFPRADYVFRFKSGLYPGNTVEVAYKKDAYSWGNKYSVTDNYQDIRFEKDMIALVEGAVKKVFPNEKYKLSEQEYHLFDYPVVSSLDEYLTYGAADLSLIVYYDIHAADAMSAEEIRQLLEDEMPENKGHIWMYVYVQTSEPDPDKMSYEQMRDFIIHEKYEKMIVTNR